MRSKAAHVESDRRQEREKKTPWADLWEFAWKHAPSLTSILFLFSFDVLLAVQCTEYKVPLSHRGDFLNVQCKYIVVTKNDFFFNQKLDEESTSFVFDLVYKYAELKNKTSIQFQYVSGS